MIRSNLTISIIVPVWNSERTIEMTVGALLMQTLAADEIIIVDDGSTDRTTARLAGFGDRIRIVRRENGGPAAARNTGVREARGEMIAFTDSDCLPEGSWLATLLAGFDLADSTRLAGVGGVVRGIGGDLTSEYIDLIRLLDPEPDVNGEIPYLITANACFQR